MKTSNRLVRSSKIVLGLLVIGSLAATSAQAQGVRVIENTIPGTPKIAITDNNLFGNAVKKVNEQRDKINAALKTGLGGGNLIAKGVTLYDLNPRVAEAKFKFVGDNGFEVMVANNYLYFHSTQPTSLGKWADPAFELHFDVKLKGKFALPTQNNPKLTITNAVLNVPHLKITGRNVVADVMVAATNVVRFFDKGITGKDHLQKAFDKYVRLDLTNKINKGLIPINKEIAKLAQQGYLPETKINGQLLEVTLTKKMTSPDTFKRFEKILRAKNAAAKQKTLAEGAEPAQP